jgi:hypothetical protein
MPIPVPINEVTGTIAVGAVVLTYVFRKRIWRGITNWINGEDDHATPVDQQNERPHDNF